jgi:hypothetical protein
MTVIASDSWIQEEPRFDSYSAKVLRIMMHSRLMLNCDQSDTGRFTPIHSNAAANLFAAQSVRSQNRPQICSLFSVNQITSDLNPGSTGLPGGESPYPLRT